ncbi:MAG TPA: CUAEP/CCAEP-tail radical SAM protein [Blastocatellia bacterium]|nr:CUAEP/CCAEP-tail radical SAM protein [Blastocatellia bacterium]
MRIVLISTYEMGRQPFGLGSPAAWLKNAGFEVRCLDLALQPLDPESVHEAGLIALHVPMHTATRIAAGVIERIRALNPYVHLCAFGLYAPMNAGFLRRLGVETILGGEFEAGLLGLAVKLANAREDSDNVGTRESAIVCSERNGSIQDISLSRLKFLVPDRSGLPQLAKYAQLKTPDGGSKITGYTEASRGCKYLCRHCPVVPIYRGQFRIVQADVVLGDIAQQVAAGASHITFGDPDFFNGPKHAIGLVRAVHDRFPTVTYDVTIKIEHLIKHRNNLAALRETGCVFITSAVESLDDRILRLLDKGHTRQDFFTAVELCECAGLILTPTFVAFHPWMDLSGYEELLSTIAELGLIDRVAPVQLALRLLIPSGSYLLALPEVEALAKEFDESSLCYSWKHLDPGVDAFQRDIESAIAMMAKRGLDRTQIFSFVWDKLQSAVGTPGKPAPNDTSIPKRATVPYLNEPWYC